MPNCSEDPDESFVTMLFEIYVLKKNICALICGEVGVCLGRGLLLLLLFFFVKIFFCICNITGTHRGWSVEVKVHGGRKVRCGCDLESHVPSNLSDGCS